MGLNVCVNLNKKKVLIVGGGCVALRKAQTLNEEGAMVTVIAPYVLEEFHHLSCKRIKRNYQIGDEADYFLVICATNDKSINQAVFDRCNEQNRWCLSVSNESHISLNTTRSIEDLTLSVSTKGQNPTFGRWVCEQMINWVDEKILDCYHAHTQLRKSLKKSTKTHNEKQELLAQALTMDAKEIEHLTKGVNDETNRRNKRQ